MTRFASRVPPSVSPAVSTPLCLRVAAASATHQAGTAEADAPLEGGAAVHYLLKTKEDTGVTLGYPCG